MPAVPEIDWSHVVGLAEPICVCLKKHLNHFTASYFEKRFDIGILSVCLNYLATFYTRVDSQVLYTCKLKVIQVLVKFPCINCFSSISYL